MFNWFKRKPKPKLRTLDEQLVSFLDLEPGWDSYDAPAISPLSVERARAIMAHEDTTRPDHICPSRDGGVAASWSKDKTYIEMEIYADGGIDLFVVPPDREFSIYIGGLK